MKNRRIIAIDPGHGGWCFAYLNDINRLARVDDPRSYIYTEGKEKPNTIGCPVLASKLLQWLESQSVLDEYVFIVEMPIGGYPQVAANINKDIGYLARAFYKYNIVTLVTCLPSDWKLFLTSKGLLPPKSGHMKPDKYTPILNTHYGITMVEHAWAAFGIAWWGIENIEEGE